MPPGIPVATVGINGALNAGILTAQILATGNTDLFKKTVEYKENLKAKVVQASEELASSGIKISGFL